MVTAFINLFPSVTWRIRTREKVLFLSFDDGPVPEATPEVLDTLALYNAKATFFCIGENMQRHPEIFSRLVREGHIVGNHTYQHLNGWRTSTNNYLQNVEMWSRISGDAGIIAPSTTLFRPPYGKLKLSQFLALKKKYKLVMWDVISRDWEQDRTADSCFERIKRKAGPGSIVVFHDSIKAKARMLPALEKTLKHFAGAGFRFESLEKYT